MQKKIVEFVPQYDGAKIIFEDWEEMHFEKTKIADAFERFWGSFVKALWVALYRADRNNTLKLMWCFDHYVQEYIEQFILWGGWEDKPDPKRMRNEINAIMENHKDHVCIIFKRDETIGEIIKNLSFNHSKSC